MHHNRLLKLTGAGLLAAALALTLRETKESDPHRSTVAGGSYQIQSGAGEASGWVTMEAKQLEDGSGPAVDGGADFVGTGKEGSGVAPDSLQQAFISAIHEIRPVTEEERKLPVNEGALYFASNPSGHGQVRFLENGAVAFSANGEIAATFEKRSLEGDNLRFLAEPSVQGSEARLEWSSGFSEVFENAAEGVHHRMVVAKNPDGPKSGKLRIGVLLREAHAQSEPDGDWLLLVSKKSPTHALKYEHPVVTDSRGRPLSARIAAVGDQGLSIEVNDQDAVYPVTVGSMIVSNIRDAGLVAPDARLYDSFGNSIAYSGNIAVIGAHGDDTPLGEDAGSAYVFTRSRTGKWSFVQQLKAPQGGRGDFFGDTVALSGDLIIASAPFASPDGISQAGCLWVYTRHDGVWGVDQRITSPSAVSNGCFGTRVGISGDRIIAPGGNPDDYDKFVFARKSDGWFFEVNLKDLLEDQQSLGDNGFEPAISEDKVVMGGFTRESSSLQDAVFVFRRNGGNWTRESILLGPYSGGMGGVVAITGNQILIGRPSAIRPGFETSTGAVSVYEFQNGTWVLKQDIYPGVACDNFQFGAKIAVSGGHAIIRAPAITPYGMVSEISGRDYVYAAENGTWVWKATLKYPDAEPGGLRITAIAISGDTALLAGSKTDLTTTSGKTKKDIDLVSVIRLTQEISVEGPGRVPFFTGHQVCNYQRWQVGKRATRTFIVKNTGLLPLERLKTKIKPGRPGDFVVAQPLPEMIQPGESAELKVAYVPKAEGIHRATVSIFSNDSDERPFEFRVKGRAVDK